MSDRRVAIIGAGWAGLAAAITLTQHQIPVTVYEAGRVAGGRARRIHLPEHDHPLDNGQHILTGAYHTCLKLIQAVNPDPEWLRLPLQLHMHQGLSLHAAALPAPLHSLVGLLSAKGLTWEARWQAVLFMLHWHIRQFKAPPHSTVAELLRTQSRTLVTCLWEPLCLATLNTPIQTASAQVFLNVIRDSLTRRRSDSDLIIPTTDLTALFPEPALRFLSNSGQQIHMGHRVKQVKSEANGLLVDGHLYRAVICATAPWHAYPFLQQLGMTTLADQLHTMPTQAIATLWLQYNTNIHLPQVMTGMTGTLAQWVFDRGQSHGQHGLMAVVISAESGQPVTDIHRAITHELHHHLGLPATPVWRKLIREQRATFACTPQITRPQHITDIPNFYLAGDYTASPYPATLEAACQSGLQCAIHLLQRHQRSS